MFTSRRTSWGILFGTALLLLLGRAGAATAGLVLDQHFGDPGTDNAQATFNAQVSSVAHYDSNGFLDQGDLAQTFTVGAIAGSSGSTLARVDVKISPPAGTTGQLIFDIRDVDSSGSPVASNAQTVTHAFNVSDITLDSDGFFEIDVSSFNLPVVQLQHLAIVLRATGDFGTLWSGRQDSTSTGYDRGSAYIRDPAATPPNDEFSLFACDCNSFFFRTYLNTPDTAAVPEPATIGLLGLGTLCLAGYARRRKRM